MQTEAQHFLATAQFRPLSLTVPGSWSLRGLLLGQGNPALELVVAACTGEPRAEELRDVWRARHGGRAAPVLVAAAYGGKVAVCGPVGEPPSIYGDLDVGQAERILLDALAAPDRHAALRLLRDVLPAAAGDLPGLRNEGLLATHELRAGVKAHEAYASAASKAKAVIRQQDRQLLEALGFRIERLDNATSILRGDD